MRETRLMKIANRRAAATGAMLIVALAPIACSDGDHPAYAKSPGEPARGITIVETPSGPYVPTPVADPGAIVGTVAVAGEIPGDSTIRPTRDQGVCGNSLNQTSIVVTGDRIAGVLIWLADIRAGKPLPLARRFELVQDGCLYAPLVQVVIAGGALNVRNHDATASRSAVVDMRTLDTVAELPFTDGGEVVPLDRQLRRPAALEIRSTTHPWMRAWVAVLDHPYFTETGPDGAFRLEGVPPGRYRIRAWHPRLGVADGTASVIAAGTDTVTLRFSAATFSAAPASVRWRPAYLAIARSTTMEMKSSAR